MLEFSLVLLASAILGVIAWNAAQRASDADVAKLQGDAIAALRQAAHKLVMSQYSAYQAGQPISRNGITLAAGDLPGQSRKPTVANLRSMDLSVNNAQNTGFYKSLANANYDITIERSAICATNPASQDCHVSGLVCLDQPVRGYSSPAGEIDTFGIGVMLASLGGSGGASLLGSPAVINGADGTWSHANAFGTAGTVCARFGWGTESDDYLRIADTRDPDFRGGLTVTGTNATGEAMRASGDLAIVDPATGNICVQILRGGTINVNCAGQLNATTGTFTGPIGSVKVGGTGTTYTVDTAGRIRAETGFWTAVGSVYGDNTLGIRAAGTVFTIQTGAGVDALAVHDSGRVGARTSVATAVLGLTDPVSAGDACTSAATQVTATQVTVAASTALRALVGGGLAICDPATGTWLAVSKSASAGAACTTSGTTAINSTGVMLVCANGSWSSIMDRMGYLVAAESWRVVDGSVVAKPPCAPGSTGSRLVVTAGNEQQNIQRLNRYVVDNGGSWTVRMTDGNGATIAGDLLAMSYCTY